MQESRGSNVYTRVGERVQYVCRFSSHNASQTIHHHLHCIIEVDASLSDHGIWIVGIATVGEEDRNDVPFWVIAHLSSSVPGGEVTHHGTTIRWSPASSLQSYRSAVNYTQECYYMAGA